MKSKEKVFIAGLIIFLILFVYFSFVILPSKQHLVEEQHIIVDKFTETQGFLLVKTTYCVLLDNGETICSFSRSAWLTIEIGDTYDTTHVEWRW